MNFVIIFEIFKTMNLFSNFVMNIIVDADGLLILEHQRRHKSLAFLRIFVVNISCYDFVG